MDRPGDARGLNAPYRANRTRAGGDLGRMDWSLKVLADVALDPKASARDREKARRGLAHRLKRLPTLHGVVLQKAISVSPRVPVCRRHSRMGAGRGRGARRGLQECGRSCRVESNSALHLLHDLVNVAVEHRYRAETLDQTKRRHAIIGAPTPFGGHGPERDVANRTIGIEADLAFKSSASQSSCSAPNAPIRRNARRSCRMNTNWCL
jgi:hypothetical protein